MSQERVSVGNQVLLWFGAAISIAEIITGTLLAPLGIQQGLVAIFLGHAIGAVILYAAGIIGAESGLSSARSVRISFGRWGSYGFSFANVLQLVGWTSIMIASGAIALNGITVHSFQLDRPALWSLLIGALIIFWVLLGLRKIGRVNVVIVTALLIACVALGIIAFRGTAAPIEMPPMAFGAAVEMNVAMSLSWLPLISDYTRSLSKPRLGTLASVAAYISGSTLMFAIGLGAALYAGTSDVAAILLHAGLGVVALGVVVFSTVTTTFLDVWSAGVSAANLSPKLNEKHVAIVVAVIGTALAIWVSLDQYEQFLYFIGSVFAPLFAILFVDYHIYGRKSVKEGLTLDRTNAILWLIGFIAYRLLIDQSTPVGITLPVMIGIGAMSFLVRRFRRFV